VKQYRSVAFIGVALLVAVLSFNTVSAHGGHDTTSEKSPDSSVSSDDKDAMTDRADDSKASARDMAKQQIEKLRLEAVRAKERANSIKDRLDGRRLKSCENHQAAIQKIVKRAATRGENHIKLFSTITDRVETFYKNKGKVLATYDQLVADVIAKKAAAQAAVAVVKTAASSDFTCSSDNPKAQVVMFRAEIKAEIAALKEYKTVVKNLIVGVKSVQGTTEGGA